jgi:hypothetical protein
MIALILYWFITTMMAIGISNQSSKKLLFSDYVISIFMGWFLVPIKLGVNTAKK